MTLELGECRAVIGRYCLARLLTSGLADTV